MRFTLHYHPLSSFCQKVLVALYERDIPFDPKFVDFSEELERAAFLKLWPIGKFPLLQDNVRNALVPESSVIIEYLEVHHPDAKALIPAAPEAGLEARRLDRFFDLYLEFPMQKITANKMLPDDMKDQPGVDQAYAQLRTAYAILEQELAGRQWAAGDSFTMADCGALPALFYANKVMPLGPAHENIKAYFDRLRQRPSCVRVLKEAEPYLHNFPGGQPESVKEGS